MTAGNELPEQRSRAQPEQSRAQPETVTFPRSLMSVNARVVYTGLLYSSSHNMSAITSQIIQTRKDALRVTLV